MKIEHRDAIDRARMHGVEPMVLAHQLMVHDLVEAALFELRNIKTPFSKLNEEDQQEVIDRITEQAKEVVYTAISIISSRSVDTIPIKIADSKFKEKSITVTGSVDAQDPNRHGLIDLSGKLALLVLAPNDYAEGVDGIRGERDQRELPLSAADLAAGMGLNPTRQAELDELERRDLENSPALFRAAEEEFKTQAGIHSGTFGGHTIDEITVMVLRKDTIDISWLQSRFALSTDDAQRVTLLLLEANVIALEGEGDSPDQNLYRITVANNEPVNLE